MAVRDGRLARNVAAKVNLPRPVKHEKRYLTHAQVEALAQATGYPPHASKHSSYDTRTNEMYRLVVLFLAYTGVRFGEMAALKVQRLNLARKRAVIAESVTPVQGKGMVWGTPKSHQRREVAIPGFLAVDLAALVAGNAPHDLVFGGMRNGQPLRVATFRTSFSSAAAVIGIPGLHPHELRHTAASLAIASGADVKVVQKMLGHASATMTLDTYGHLFEDRLDEVATAMDKRAHSRSEQGEQQRPGHRRYVTDTESRVQSASNDVDRGQDRRRRWPPDPHSCRSEGHTRWYPRRDSNPRYRLERAAC